MEGSSLHASCDVKDFLMLVVAKVEHKIQIQLHKLIFKFETIFIERDWLEYFNLDFIRSCILAIHVDIKWIVFH